MEFKSQGVSLYCSNIYSIPRSSLIPRFAFHSNGSLARFAATDTRFVQFYSFQTIFNSLNNCKYNNKYSLKCSIKWYSSICEVTVLFCTTNPTNLFQFEMADLAWIAVQMISIDHLTVFHECQRCKRQVGDKQTECCRASNFIMRFKIG